MPLLSSGPFSVRLDIVRSDFKSMYYTPVFGSIAAAAAGMLLFKFRANVFPSLLEMGIVILRSIRSFGTDTLVLFLFCVGGLVERIRFGMTTTFTWFKWGSTMFDLLCLLGATRLPLQYNIGFILGLSTAPLQLLEAPCDWHRLVIEAGGFVQRFWLGSLGSVALRNGLILGIGTYCSVPLIVQGVILNGSPELCALSFSKLFSPAAVTLATYVDYVVTRALAPLNEGANRPNNRENENANNEEARRRRHHHNHGHNHHHAGHHHNGNGQHGRHNHQRRANNHYHH